MEDYKMSETECIANAAMEWVKEDNERRCVIMLMCDENDVISTVVNGNGFNLTTMLASSLDEEKNKDLSEIFSQAQKMMLLKRIFEK